MSKLEYLDYDLNSLFSLNYSFDTLKLMLQGIGKNQKMLNHRLNILEGKGDISPTEYIKDHKETAHHHYHAEDSKHSQLDIIPGDSKYSQLDIIPEDNSNSSPPLKKKRESIPSIGNMEEEDNISPTDYNLRIKILETKVNKVYSLLSSSSSQKELSNLEEDIQSKLVILYDKNNDLNNKLLSIESTLEELKVKSSDFNIYELLKDTSNMGEGSTDSSKILIQALENKIFKKFAFEDEKIKLNEKDIHKAKTDIIDLKNSNDCINRAISILRDDMADTKASIEALSNSTDDKMIELHNSFNNMKKQFDERINNINEDLKAINEYNDLNLRETDLNKELNPIESIAGLVTEKEYRKLREGVNKRLSEIERNHAALDDRCNFDPIYAIIASIKTDLSDKVTSQELYNSNDKLVAFGDTINCIRNDQDLIIDEIKQFKSYQNQVSKKLEMIQSQMLLIKIDDSSDRTIKKEFSFHDIGKYVEMGAFNDFLKMYHKDNERMKRDNEELRRNNDEINELLKSKATEMQLNQMEDYLISMIEEMKNNFNRKYADRIDTNKNFKSIESQMKHIIEVYIKRSDKGDSWLIAKKPIGGYSCASCENYIGDLTEKNEFMAWNKVPGKETFDRTYRVSISWINK